jgi:hypothetical protein
MGCGVKPLLFTMHHFYGVGINICWEKNKGHCFLDIPYTFTDYQIHIKTRGNL